MNFITPLAALLGSEVEHVADRVKRAVIVNIALAILGGAAVLFLIVAGFIALALEVGGVYAALSFAGFFLLLALIVFVSVKIADARRRRLQAERRRSSEGGAFLTTAALTALPVLLRSPLVRNLGLPAVAIATAFMLFNKSDDDRS